MVPVGFGGFGDQFYQGQFVFGSVLTTWQFGSVQFLSVTFI